MLSAKKRSSGLLLHISSLPSPFGIGDFGPSAHSFIDFLHEARQSYWQILPLNPTEGVSGYSPYSSPSAFAINTHLISPEFLCRDGLCAKEDIASHPNFSSGHVDFEVAITFKEHCLEKAFRQFQSRKLLRDAYQEFLTEHAFWLDDYALYMVLKRKNNYQLWTRWPDGWRARDKKALTDFQNQFQDDIEKHKFLQFTAYRQWGELKEYCARKNVSIIGDIPIYVNYDSADVWANPELFKLDKDLCPAVVAGVPPDYFSKTGQRWGNPVYNWEALSATGYQWWKNRLKINLALFDVVRIDHFRGLVQFWEVPAEHETAMHGTWADVPTYDFFDALKKEFPEFPVIAEDLGYITEDVHEVMAHYHLPGMKILMFAFDDQLETHPYLPHNFSENCVVFTGTHDNNTARGWYRTDTGEHTRHNLNVYFKDAVDEQTVAWTLIRAAFHSRAFLAVTPMQDVLNLDEGCRMNIPGTSRDNWLWRVKPEQLTQDVCRQLADLTTQSHRSP